MKKTNNILDETAKKDFLEYSTEVIKQRALPSLEDGLKPIHRRILYMMNEMKLDPSKPTRKSAKVVGEVMGRAHPHGDSSIYGALVRLAQPWKMRYPLITFQGNIGTASGDSAAASRYTECKLSPLGKLMCDGIDFDIIPSELNYSGEELLPTILPTKFPNLLVNPNLGIAVGMSCTTYPHNLKEMCGALIAMNKLENVNDFSIDDFLKYVKGPDFPTGGIIINGEDIRRIYTDGRGGVKVRSKYEIEKEGNTTYIVVKEIPYLVDLKEKIIKQIKQMTIDGDTKLFKDAQDTTDKTGFELRITLNKDVEPQEAINFLCRKTCFEDVLSCNYNVLYNGVPQQTNILYLMREYLNFRHQIIIKQSEKSLKKVEDRIHIIDGLLIALQDIDGVVKIIKESINKSFAMQSLMQKYNLTNTQADAILDMKLSRLTSLETSKLVDEKNNLENEKIKLLQLINNADSRKTAIENELNFLVKNFGDDRRTQIICNEENMPIEEIKEDKDYFLYSDGTYSHTLDKTNKSLVKVFKCKNAAEIIAYNSIGEIGPRDSLTNANYFLNRKEYIISVSKNGLIKLSKTSEYNLTRKMKGVKVKDGDSIIFIDSVNLNDNIILIDSINSKLLNIPISTLSIAGKLTQGVKTGLSQIDAAVVGSHNNKILFVTNENKGRLVDLSTIEADCRTNKGQTITQDTVYCQNTNNQTYAIVKNGLICIDTNKMPLKNINAVGAAITSRKIEKLI